jgi:hypothetical protein
MLLMQAITRGGEAFCFETNVSASHTAWVVLMTSVFQPRWHDPGCFVVHLIGVLTCTRHADPAY